MMPLTNAEIKHVAEAAAEEAVRRTFLTLGVDASDPEAVLKMQRDFAHIRVWRESVDTMRTKGLVVAMGIIVSGVAAAIWMAIKG